MSINLDQSFTNLQYLFLDDATSTYKPILIDSIKCILNFFNDINSINIVSDDTINKYYIFVNPLDLKNIHDIYKSGINKIKIILKIRLYQKKIIINYTDDINIIDRIIDDIYPDFNQLIENEKYSIKETLDLSKYNFKYNKSIELKKLLTINDNSLIHSFLQSLLENYRKISDVSKNNLVNKFRHLMSTLTGNDLYEKNHLYSDQHIQEIAFLLNTLVIYIKPSFDGPLPTTKIKPETKLINKSNINTNKVIIIEGISNFSSILINNKFNLTKEEYNSYTFDIEKENEFSIMTFNVFYNNCDKLQEIDEKIKYPKPTLICTQEANLEDDYKFPNYTFIGNSGDDDSREIVAAYKLNNLDNIDNIDKITTELNHNFKRYGILFDYKNIKIANLHLAGGRGYDQFLFKSKDLFTKILNFKLELLKKIIEKKPDIILGDFNSVLPMKDQESEDLYLQSQYEYFKKKLQRELNEEEIKKIKDINNIPYERLISSGYTYAKPENNNLFTNILGKTIVDCIWYKKEKLKLLSCNIIDILDNYTDKKDCISDHNPVIADFEIIELDDLLIYKKKYFKYKNKYLKNKKN